MLRATESVRMGAAARWRGARRASTLAGVRSEMAEQMGGEPLVSMTMSAEQVCEDVGRRFYKRLALFRLQFEQPILKEAKAAFESARTENKAVWKKKHADRRAQTVPSLFEEEQKRERTHWQGHLKALQGITAPYEEEPGLEELLEKAQAQMDEHGMDPYVLLNKELQANPPSKASADPIDRRYGPYLGIGKSFDADDPQSWMDRWEQSIRPDAHLGVAHMAEAEEMRMSEGGMGYSASNAEDNSLMAGLVGEDDAELEDIGYTEEDYIEYIKHRTAEHDIDVGRAEELIKLLEAKRTAHHERLMGEKGEVKALSAAEKAASEARAVERRSAELPELPMELREAMKERLRVRGLSGEEVEEELKDLVSHLGTAVTDLSSGGPLFAKPGDLVDPLDMVKRDAPLDALEYSLQSVLDEEGVDRSNNPEAFERLSLSTTQQRKVNQARRRFMAIREMRQALERHGLRPATWEEEEAERKRLRVPVPFGSEPILPPTDYWTRPGFSFVKEPDYRGAFTNKRGYSTSRGSEVLANLLANSKGGVDRQGEVEMPKEKQEVYEALREQIDFGAEEEMFDPSQMSHVDLAPMQEMPTAPVMVTAQAPKPLHLEFSTFNTMDPDATMGPQAQLAYRTRKVVMRVHVGALGLGERAEARLAQLAGARYDRATNVLRLKADKYPTKGLNAKYAKQMFVALIEESLLANPNYVPFSDLNVSVESLAQTPIPAPLPYHAHINFNPSPLGFVSSQVRQEKQLSQWDALLSQL